jgi:hypothetical protein
MTVGELIEQLQMHPKDLEVHVLIRDLECEVEEVSLDDARLNVVISASEEGE